MQRARAGHAEAQGEQAGPRPADLIAGAGPRARATGRPCRHAAAASRRFRESARGRRSAGASRSTLPVGDIDQNGALGAGFADAAALKIAGKDDIGIARDHLGGVDMAERPVIVVLGAQVVEAAGRVGVVAGRAVEEVCSTPMLNQPAAAPDRRGRGFRSRRGGQSRARAGRRATRAVRTSPPVRSENYARRSGKIRLLVTSRTRRRDCP